MTSAERSSSAGSRSKLLLTLEVTGIEKVLPIYPTQEAALAAFALPPAAAAE